MKSCVSVNGISVMAPKNRVYTHVILKYSEVLRELLPFIMRICLI